MDVVVILRAVLALVCVFGLLWFMARRAGGKLPAARRAPSLSVVARQTLGGRSAVALRRRTIIAPIAITTKVMKAKHLAGVALGRGLRRSPSSPSWPAGSSIII